LLRIIWHLYWIKVCLFKPDDYSNTNCCSDKSILRLTRFSLTKPSNDSAALALTHWTRSAAQRNIDALVKVADYYYHGLGVPEQEQATRLETAARYYQSAADTQVSALAMWSLGWMYENGIGMPQVRFAASDGEKETFYTKGFFSSFRGLSSRQTAIRLGSRDELGSLRPGRALAHQTPRSQFVAHPHGWKRRAEDMEFRGR